VLGEFRVAAIPLLISARRDEYIGIRMHAAEALGRLRPTAREAIPGLRISMADEHGPPTDENSVAGLQRGH
jgi:hypothetical protein